MADERENHRLRVVSREEQDLTTQRAQRKAAESAEKSRRERRGSYGEGREAVRIGGFVTAQAGEGLTVRTKGRTEVGGTRGWSEAIGCRHIGGALSD
jgi:hypothetical protein